MTQFGINKDTKALNAVPIDTPYKGDNGKYVFPVCVLRNVEFEAKKETKKGETAALTFTFSDTKGEKTHNKVEFPFEVNDEKSQKRLEALNVRLKHLYTAFMEFPDKGIGEKATTFEAFLKAVAKAFNEGRDGKPIYKNEEGKNIMFFLKITWSKIGRRDIPYAPNFIEKYTKDGPHTLDINPKYDLLESPSSSMDFAGGSPIDAGAISDEDMPTFE